MNQTGLLSFHQVLVCGSGRHANAKSPKLERSRAEAVGHSRSVPGQKGAIQKTSWVSSHVVLTWAEPCVYPFSCHSIQICRFAEWKSRSNVYRTTKKTALEISAPSAGFRILNEFQSNHFWADEQINCSISQNAVANFPWLSSIGPQTPSITWIIPCFSHILQAPKLGKPHFAQEMQWHLQDKQREVQSVWSKRIGVWHVRVNV